MSDFVWMIESPEEKVELNLLDEPIWEDYGSDLFIIFYTDTIVPQNAKRFVYGKKRGIKWCGAIDSIKKDDVSLRIRMADGMAGYIPWYKSWDLFRDKGDK